MERLSEYLRGKCENNGFAVYWEYPSGVSLFPSPFKLATFRVAVEEQGDDIDDAFMFLPHEQQINPVEDCDSVYISLGEDDTFYTTSLFYFRSNGGNVLLE